MLKPFSDRVSGLQPSAIREILKFTADPEVISFAAGNPAPEAFPSCMERSFLFASEYGFIVSQAAEFVTKRRKKAPGAGALRGRKIRVYFAAISAAAAAQRSVIGLPPSGAGCTMPGTPCSAPLEGGCAVFFRFRAGTFKNYTVLPFFHAKMRS